MRMQGCRALRHLLTYCVTLQQVPCGICSMVRTDFRVPAATPPQQEPSGIGSMIALPDAGGTSRFLESLTMCLRAPLRAQGLWPTHENVALPGIKALAYISCDIAAGAVRDMQHGSNRLLGSCCHASAAGAVRDMQHDCFARGWWDFQIP